MPLKLNTLETRILGCLLEKERLTPENYPLSLHSLTAACNQSSNRDPISAYDEKTVETGVNALREKKLAMVLFGAGSRVQKYRHRLEEHYELRPEEGALLCVLLLRGPQTLGELRTRTERYFTFANLDAVRECLDDLGKNETALVALLPQRPGQKEQRYIQRLSDPSVIEDSTDDAPTPESDRSGSMRERVENLERLLGDLQREVRTIREELAAFRHQFE
jgi:uncharacterized protein YceH (UPF0502 family)